MPARGGRRLRRLPRPAFNAVPGMVEALEEVECTAGAGRFSASVSACSFEWRAAGLEKVITDGLGWIPGDVREMTPTTLT